VSTRKSRQQQELDVVESVRWMIASAVLFSHQVAEQLKLGASDAQFLTLLDVHGPLTPGRFAAMTGLKTGTVTGVLDRLENAGLVRRERDSADRRKVIVSLTDDSRARVDPHYQGQADQMLQLLARYDDEQLAVITDFVGTIAGASFPTTSAEG
jgi:DNA-binding MarR family transcriptional regulator